MKLIRIISSMDPSSGGPCQGIRNITPHLSEMGIKTEVVSLDPIEAEFKTNDPFHIFKTGIGKTGFKYNKELFIWLVNNLPKYDLAIVHGIWQYQNYSVFKAIKLLKSQNKKVPKVAIMPHGMLDPYFQKANSRKLKAIRNEVIWRLTEKRAINAADAILFTCEEELLLARTTFKGYKPKAELNIGYGIQPPPAYKPEMVKKFENLTPNLNKKPFWLFLSRIHHKKGVDRLIEAYLKLAAEVQNIPDLVIAGPKTNEFAEKLINSTKGHSNIHFPGMLQGEEKWGAFYGCSAYLLPSFQENFGIAIVEAMAAKKPVLITEQVNIWREIQKCNGGIIIKNNNPDSIYDALKHFVGLAPSKLAVMGENAYQVFLDNFYIKNTAKRFAEILK